MLHRIASNSWFALANLALVVLSGLLWIFKPELGLLPTITIALIPWAIRILAGLAPVKITPFDVLLVLFLLTAWVGFWAAYDIEAAWSKVWLIVLAILLYYALSSQPVENLEWVCAFLFCIGVGVAIFFLLTHDFVDLPRKVMIVNRIGNKLMEIIPRLGWTPIHPNYVAGIAAITTPFILYPAAKLVKKKTLLSTLVLIIILGGSGVALLAIVMATSRGILMAIASATGIWFIWQIVRLIGGRLRLRREAIFPPLVFICLCAVVLILYAGPANSASDFLTQGTYGTGSRAEVFTRSVYLAFDFPFTGGGLDAFPGLYSYYMLGIPNFYIPNSHNLFLDVAIEQGVLGGASFLIIFLMSIWFTARGIVEAISPQARVIGWLIFFTLIISFVHGMVDDYLYNGSGTLLLFTLVGLSKMVQPDLVHAPRPNYLLIPSFGAIVLIGVFTLNLNSIRAAWNANLGAVQMAKVELAGFPTGQWTEPSILPELEQAEAFFHTALLADPTNRTANHRLGLINMLRKDFQPASKYLEVAYQKAPNHRGIIKAMGFSYAWLGERKMAELFLSKIPEARHELDVYIWWWGLQGEPELAQIAYNMSSELNR